MLKPISATATIATSGTTSGAVELNGLAVVGLYTPSTFDGTTITFTACDTIDGTYVALATPASGTTYSITVTASRFYYLDRTIFFGARYIKAVAGSAQTTTDTILTFMLAQVD